MINRLALFGSFFLPLSLIAAPQITPLREMRDKLTLPSYSASDRQLLADQADFMIRNLYVNLDIKIRDFGIDPLPRLDQIRQKAKAMSGPQLHTALSSVFTDLHDLHTSYIAPRPLACGVSFIPLRFESVIENGKPMVIVSRRLKVHSELTQDIAIGDRLIEVQDTPVESVLTELGEISGGANPDAIRTRAVALLSMRSFSTQAPPESDKVTLKFQGANGPYNREIPWFVLIDESCLKESTRLRPAPGFMELGEDDYQKRYNRIFGTPASPPATELTWGPSEALKEVFEMAPLRTPAGIIGYIQIKGFSWENRNLDVATVLEGFRRQIEGELAGAIGLVIDVRGNPGGYITFAEKLIQFFSSRPVEPTTVQMLANSLNESIFLKANGQNNRWTDAIRKAERQGARYTAPLAITSPSEANNFGQVWYRPVIVLTDAACFSACDLFAAGMQDSGAGYVIGLHRTTGAGGANVMEYRTFNAIMGSSAGNPFPLLPFHQNMRVAWRQAIRSGKHRGELLEDKGVESDFVVPLRRADIGAESRLLMKQVHKILDERRPNYTSGLGVRRGNSVLLSNGGTAEWEEKVYGVDAINIEIDGKNVAQLPVAYSENPTEEHLQINHLNGIWKDQRVALVGKRLGKSVFRAVRELMWRGEYTGVPADGISIDFAGGNLGILRTVSLKGNVDSGWQIVDGKLRIGSGSLYDNDVLARAILPLKLDGNGGMIKFDIRLEAEDENDGLRIYAINPDDGDRHDIFAGSRISHETAASVDLPKGWQRADVVFEFESDENWNMSGPVIGNLSIKQ
jgi:C-terminal processing protease CtpA/Prc